MLETRSVPFQPAPAPPWRQAGTMAVGAAGLGLAWLLLWLPPAPGPILIATVFGVAAAWLVRRAPALLGGQRGRLAPALRGHGVGPAACAGLGRVVRCSGAERREAVMP